MEQSNSVRLGLHAYAAFAACQEPWECARYLFSRAPTLPCGSFEEKQPIVTEDEPRINTNRPEDRWTSFNHKRRQNASAIWCPGCDDVMG